jgi:ribose transport system permease protein/AI-2 transport system permease protein
MTISSNCNPGEKAFSMGYLWKQREFIVFLLLIFEMAMFGILTNGFLQIDNLMTILQNSVDLAVVAAGMTLIMIMGGIDISVGSLLGVIAIMVGWMIQADMGAVPIIFTAVLIGVAGGTINGLIVAYGKVPAIIATLGTSNILRALIFGMLGGVWITGLPPTMEFLNIRIFGWLPAVTLIIVIVYIIFWYFAKYMRLGRAIYAVGNSAEASYLSGINVGYVTVAAHGIIGALTGVAALSYIARMGSVEMSVGLMLPLQAIAATVIGGTSVTGGRGSIMGTLIGVLFINILQNGILLLGVPSMMEWAIVGFFIIISVSFDLLGAKKILH